MKCVHCKGNHLAGDPNCPTKKQFERDLQRKEQLTLKNRYHELLSMIEDEEDEIEGEDTKNIDESSSQQTKIPSAKRRITINCLKKTPKKSKKSYAKVVNNHDQHHLQASKVSISTFRGQILR